MQILSLLMSPAPYHVISYGTLLGTEFFQSFVGGIVAYRALPRPQFASLQQSIFPIYFAIQTALPVVLVLTYPGAGLSESSISGVLAPQNRWSVALPLVTTFASGAINLLYFGPQTTKIMRLRKHQETRDGKKSYDPSPHSPEMQKLNKEFGITHGMSALVNMFAFIATVWYGINLSDRM